MLDRRPTIPSVLTLALMVAVWLAPGRLLAETTKAPGQESQPPRGPVVVGPEAGAGASAESEKSGPDSPADMAKRFPLYVSPDGYRARELLGSSASAEVPDARPTGRSHRPWAMFQGGPGHTGHSPDDTAEVPFVLKWRLKTGRRFEASPIVAGGRAYIVSSGGIVQAVDFETGKSAWEATLDGAVMGTPALSGGVLCIPTLDGNVYTLDARTGRLRGKWKSETPNALQAQIVGQTGAALLGDLVTDEGQLYYAGHGGQLHQVDLGQSALVSKTRLPGPVRSGGLALRGRIAVAACASGELAAVRVGGPDTPLIWKIKSASAGPDAFLVPPVIAGDAVLATTGRDQYLFARSLLSGRTLWGATGDGRIVAVAADDQRAYVTVVVEGTHCSLLALDLDDGRPAWSARLPAKIISPPSVANGLVFVGLSGGSHCLAAFEARTGELLWQAREFAGVSSAPVPYAGHLLILTDSGYLAAYETCDVLTGNPLLGPKETAQPPYLDWQGPMTDFQWRFAEWSPPPAQMVYRMTDFTFVLHPEDDATPWRVVSKQMLPSEPFLLSPTFTGLLFPRQRDETVRVIGVRGIDRQSQRFYDVALPDLNRALTALIVARKLRGQWRPIYVNNWFRAWREEVPGVTDKSIAGYYVNKGRPFEVVTRLGDRGTFELLSFFQQALYLQAPSNAVMRGPLVWDGTDGGPKIVVTHYWGCRPKDLQSRLLVGEGDQLMLLQLAQ